MAGDTAIGDESVRRRTGKAWPEWFRILDRWRANRKSHPEIASYLREEHGLNGWWSQMVTVGYERARGLREVHQVQSGFQISVSRVIGASAHRAFEAFTAVADLSRWFTKRARLDLRPGGKYSNADGDRGEYRTIRPPSLLRFTWDNPKQAPGTLVEVHIATKGPQRSTVAVVHSKLASRKQADEMKQGWSWALDSLRSYLETGEAIRFEDWTKARAKPTQSSAKRASAKPRTKRATAKPRTKRAKPSPRTRRTVR
jgi:uncharacterized protein YndB with AHSA1/START domain